MNLIQMLAYLRGIFSNATQTTGCLKIPRHSIIQPVTTLLNANINISFPGYKSTATQCDYLVQLVQGGNSINVSHEDIMTDIYNCVLANQNNGTIIESLLSDISHNWEHVTLNNFQGLTFNNFTLDELIECICYISAQEEINYPRSRGFDGYKRPFYSYLEAVYAAYNRPLVSFSRAVIRCNSSSRFQPIIAIPYNII